MMTSWLLQPNGTGLENIGQFLTDEFGPNLPAATLAVSNGRITVYPAAGTRAPNQHWRQEGDTFTTQFDLGRFPASNTARHWILAGITSRNEVALINLRALDHIGVEHLDDPTPIQRSWIMQLLTRSPESHIEVTDPALHLGNSRRLRRTDTAQSAPAPTSTVVFGTDALTPGDDDPTRAVTVVSTNVAGDPPNVVLCDDQISSLYVAGRYFPLWRRYELTDDSWHRLAGSLRAAHPIQPPAAPAASAHELDAEPATPGPALPSAADTELIDLPNQTAPAAAGDTPFAPTISPGPAIPTVPEPAPAATSPGPAIPTVPEPSSAAMSPGPAIPTVPEPPTPPGPAIPTVGPAVGEQRPTVADDHPNTDLEDELDDDATATDPQDTPNLAGPARDDANDPPWAPGDGPGPHRVDNAQPPTTSNAGPVFLAPGTPGGVPAVTPTVVSPAATPVGPTSTASAADPLPTGEDIDEPLPAPAATNAQPKPTANWRRPGLYILGDTFVAGTDREGNPVEISALGRTGPRAPIRRLMMIATRPRRTIGRDEWIPDGASRRQTVKQIRDIIGVENLIVDEANGTVSLSDNLYYDWLEFLDLVGMIPAKASDENLLAAMDIVRGRTFNNISADDYDWTDVKVLRDNLRTIIPDAAVALAYRQVEWGQHAAAYYTARLGLQVSDDREDLWEIAAATVADTDRKHLIYELEATIPHPSKTALKQFLGQKERPA